MAVGRARTPKRRAFNASVFVQDGQIVAMDKERDELDSANVGIRDQEVITQGLSSLDLGEELIIQKGVYFIKAKMEINKSGIQIRGDRPVWSCDPGPAGKKVGTMLVLSDNIDSMFHVKGIHRDEQGNEIWDWKEFVQFENLYFNGGNRAYATTCIDADHASGLVVRNCFFELVKGSAIDINDAYSAYIDRSYFSECGDSIASKPVVKFSASDSMLTYINIEKSIFEPSYYKWIEVDPAAVIDHFLIDGGYFEMSDLGEPFTGIQLPIGAIIRHAKFCGSIRGYFIAGRNPAIHFGFHLIEGCRFDGGGVAGAGGCISLDGVGISQIKNNIFLNVMNDAIYANYQFTDEYAGNKFFDCVNAIHFGNSGNMCPSCDIHDNTFRDIKGIAIQSPGQYNKIHGNTFHLIWAGRPIWSIYQDNVSIFNNSFESCTNYIDPTRPATTKIFDNTGYKTENQGIAIFAQGQISLNKIRHGLAVSPNGINGNPGIGLTALSWGDATRCWLYGVDSAYLMISLDRDPGPSGAKIRWFTVK